MRVTIIGAGVAGLTAALELAERGAEVRVVERAARLGEAACSWCAGGMLAPWCEGESAPVEVVELGAQALEWWGKRVPGVARDGTLVVAAPRDAGEIERFAARTRRHERVDEARIGALEPDLAGRFRKGLFFAEEGHLDPRAALRALAERLGERGVAVEFGVARSAPLGHADAVLDCRGFAARDELEELRGVRGEMVVLRTKDISFRRPIRFLHPRIPLYVVPRGDGLFMIGATMIESAARGPVDRPFGDRIAERRLCAAPGFWRSGNCRDARRCAPRLSRQFAARRQAGGEGLFQRPVPPRLPALARLGAAGGRGDSGGCREP